LFDRANLLPKERLLIHGGSSGIGTTAIQMASSLGSIVYATAGSDDKCHACERLGATKAFNYKKEDFLESILSETNGLGVNVILDMVAGDYVNKNIKLLSDDGRLIIIAFLKGPKAEANFGLVMSKRLVITGSTLRPQSEEFKGDIARKLYKNIWPLLESGKIKAEIDSTFDLSDASKAHERMETNKHIGKIILKI
jgi:NADPH2:quinone reductase